jgi:type IV pilus assembly protein PilP
MRKNPISALYAAALLLAILAGCSKEDKPAQAPAPKQAPPAKPAAQPAPVQKQMSSVAKPGAQLDFRQRTDPFKPFAPVEVAPPVQVGQPINRSSSDLLPIQTFDVSKFKVAGIIAGLKQNRALLIDPTGKGYVVQEGMVIGSNDGRITKITSSAIEVVERFREDSGRIKKRKVVLTLSKKR